MTGKLLQQAIQQYSTDKNKSPVAYVSLAHQLGPTSSARISYTAPCKRLLQTQKTPHQPMEDVQTIVRIFSQCTVHKMTQLSGCDFYNLPLDNLPNQYYLWESDLTSQFSEMTNHVLSSITNKTSLPSHSHLIPNMSAIKQGGLGLQHPRTNTISSYMSTTKRCLQYTHQGIWLGYNKNRPILPHSIRHLYSDWETSKDAHEQYSENTFMTSLPYVVRDPILISIMSSMLPSTNHEKP